MTRRPTPHRTAERGFTLVELMVALVVMAVMLTVIFGTMHRSQHDAQRVTAVAEERQMARGAVQLMEREMRMAGSGWGRDTVQAARGGASWSLYGINPGYGGAASSDSIFILGAWDVYSKLTASMATAASNMTVDSTRGFYTGDFVVVTNGRSCHMFQLTGVSGSPGGTLQHANTSTYNTGHALWPVGGGYAAGSYVYRVTLVTYRFDSTTYKRPTILRQVMGGTPQIVAYNVDGFRVYFQMQDSSVTRSPVSLNFVDRIMPVVLTKISDPRYPTLRDSVWAAIRPRTF